MQRTIPTLITSINNITQISAGQFFSIILNNIGEVYGFGKNNVIFFLII
jgi:alpha-tubulin suppressor-like RCC1 family protein